MSPPQRPADYPVLAPAHGSLDFWVELTRTGGAGQFQDRSPATPRTGGPGPFPDRSPATPRFPQSPAVHVHPAFPAHNVVSAKCLTHLCQVDSPILLNWINLFPKLGMSSIFITIFRIFLTDIPLSKQHGP
ncbi:hypothetical protein DPMN_135792 [Dreissena polymorpha]|uniref:Uncharacterized protein n=1 Tax=Dreissena polymorpha TaxID=45954 RepID=A0A9D4FZS8_DREPO|nr:hypothetical protein DPMN_135792 [Dreissena polymorpha]